MKEEGRKGEIKNIEGWEEKKGREGKRKDEEREERLDGEKEEGEGKVRVGREWEMRR